MPSKVFRSRFRKPSPFIIVKLSGILPSRRLLLSDSDVNCGLTDVIEGIDPVSWLLFRYRFSIFGNVKKLCGILPDILLLPPKKSTISVRLPSGVRYPTSPLADKRIESTRR